MSKEVKSWPYDFPQSQDFIPPSQRGTLFGRLLVQDSSIKGGRFLYASSAYVGLALPGPAGSWQRESKARIYILTMPFYITTLKFHIMGFQF